MSSAQELYEAEEKRIEALVRSLGVTMEHKDDVKRISNYFNEHKVNELFNELMLNILHTRPADAKQFVVQQLKTL